MKWVPMIVVALSASGCNRDNALAGPSDAVVAANDLVAIVDGSSIDLNAIGVACGNMTCSHLGYGCCTIDEGATGSCMSFEAGCSQSSPYYCDGPEDCGAGMVCCEDVGTPSATCTTSAGCIRNSITYVLCHQDSDCASAVNAPHCCPTVGQYLRCTNNLCGS